MSEKEFLRNPGLGVALLEDFKEKVLNPLGLTFKMEVPGWDGIKIPVCTKVTRPDGTVRLNREGTDYSLLDRLRAEVVGEDSVPLTLSFKRIYSNSKQALAKARSIARREFSVAAAGEATPARKARKLVRKNIVPAEGLKPSDDGFVLFSQSLLRLGTTIPQAQAPAITDAVIVESTCEEVSATTEVATEKQKPFVSAVAQKTLNIDPNLPRGRLLARSMARTLRGVDTPRY